MVLVPQAEGAIRKIQKRREIRIVDAGGVLGESKAESV
jgi:hypothetical protein